MSKKQTEYENIVQQLGEAAKVLKIHPHTLTKAQVLQNSTITDWQLRKHGGLAGIKNANFPLDEKDLALIEQQRDVSRYVNKLEKQLGQKLNLEKRIQESIDKQLSDIKIRNVSIPKKPAVSKNKKNMTMELMLSDIHYGKKTDTFDLEICRIRIRDLVKTFIDEYNKERQFFNVDNIIIALIGDVIESYSFHGLESARSCEFTDSVQIKEAIESLFNDVILPIAKTGVKITIPAVTGNHDRVELKRTFHNPGETNFTWVIYNSLDLLCKAAKLTNVTMIIPKTSYVILPIYNNYCLYEHGDNSKSNSPDNLLKLMEKRSRQEGKLIDFGRFGHYHEFLCAGRGKIIVNESVPGQDSFSQVNGWDSHAGQTINYYVQTDERPNCFYKSFPVYLD